VRNEDCEVNKERRFWLSVLARAHLRSLEAQWATLEPKPECRYLRTPEVGMAMVRGRISGSGRPFNLGEVTVTRCTVQLNDGQIGCGFIQGRSKRHAELVAKFDALLQVIDYQKELMEKLIQPMHRVWQAQQARHKAEVSATKVDFFTLLRGE